MRKLVEQLKRELSKKRVDKHYVALIEDALSDRGIDFKAFVDSGRFMTRETYVEHNDSSVLSDDAVDVVVYLGGYVVQVRKPDVFFVDGYESKSLDDVEAWLWESDASVQIGKGVSHE